MNKIQIKTFNLCLLVFVILNINCQQLDPVNVTMFNNDKMVVTPGPFSASVSYMFADIGDEVTSYGICWSADHIPTITDSKITISGKPEKQIEFTSELNDLLPETYYFVRAYAISGTKTIYSNPIDFVTLQSTITVTTTISVISDTIATSGGTITAEGGTIIKARGVCWSKVTNPTISLSTKTSDSTGTGTFISNIKGLAVSTKYFVRAYATINLATIYGDELSFTTSALPSPTAITVAASNLSTTSATLNGAVNAKGQNTDVTFEYGETASYGYTVQATPNPITGNAITPVGTNITGLIPNTLYHYRVIATYAGGTISGSDLTFTTNSTPAPTTTTLAATNLTATSATLNGSINANGQNTTVTFEYGLTTSYGNTVSASPEIVTGNTVTGVSVNIAGLTKNTLYHFRVKASSAGGTIYGSDLTFTSSNIPAPISATTAASNVSTTTVTLNGSVNANGQSTTVTFEYGTTISFGTTTSATPGTVTGSSATAVSANISGLLTNTTYYFRIKAASAGGTVYGNDLSFKTDIPAPTAITSAASVIMATSVVLNGSTNANGQSTTATFEYGTTTSYGSVAAAAPGPIGGNSVTSLNANISGLASNTLYHFRVKAVSAGGTSYGNDFTFTTLPSASYTVTDIDGNVYSTVTIGTQVWMVENLKTTKYNDGTIINYITDPTAWTTAGAAYCWYDNQITNKATYGAIYNWYAIDPSSNGGRSICPTGWHVPTYEEWNTLAAFLGGATVAGGKMKETGTAHWLSPNTDADNSSGFTALGGGYRVSDGTYYGKGETGLWWASENARAQQLLNQHGALNLGGNANNTFGCSVRCIRD